MNAQPSISMVTPSYNQARFLEETIQSVLNQDYCPLEYIIMDGGSTDGSVAIIRRHADRLTHWASQPDEGQVQAINEGWRIATGEVICWLNSDDRLISGALVQVGRAFAANPQTVAVVGGGSNIDEVGRTLGDKPPNRLDLAKVLMSQTFHQPSVFLRRRVLDEVGWLDPDLPLVFDWEYWIRLLLTYEAKAFHYLERSVAEIRIWEGTKTFQGRMDASSEERRSVLERVFGSDALPPEVRPLYAQAMATTYWRQGHLQREARHPWAGLQSVRRARELAPELYSWSFGWAIQFWLQTYLRFPFWLIPYWVASRLWRGAQRLFARS